MSQATNRRLLDGQQRYGALLVLLVFVASCGAVGDGSAADPTSPAAPSSNGSVDSSSSSGALDESSESAARALSAFVESQTLDPETEFVDLTGCPAGSMESMLATLASAEHDTKVAQAFVLPGAAPIRDVSCTIGIDPEIGIGTGSTGIESWLSGVSTGAGDLETYLAAAYGTPGDDREMQVDVRPPEMFGGGQFRYICVIDRQTPGYNSCEVDWVHADLIVYLLATGEQALEVDLDRLRSTLEGSLEQIVQDVAQI